MFARLDGAIDHALEREREACRRRLGEIREQTARLAQEVTELVRAADDRRDWQAAGCASSAQWLAQIYRSDYRTAQRITRTSDALRKLPALDHALSLGDLTLDQVAAAAPLATPETDAQLARIAVGKAPSEIEVAARTLAPPVVADDQALYQRRALRMTWTNGKRELRFNGSLPLEQGVAFEQAIWSIAKPLRAADKKAGMPVLEWQQYTADALVTLATQPQQRRRWCEAQSDDADRAPSARTNPRSLEGTGPVSTRAPSGSAATPAGSRSECCGSDLVPSRVTRCASYPPDARADQTLKALPRYHGCSATREAPRPPPTVQDNAGGPVRATTISSLLCPRHHTLLHQHHHIVVRRARRDSRVRASADRPRDTPPTNQARTHPALTVGFARPAGPPPNARLPPACDVRYCDRGRTCGRLPRPAGPSSPEAVDRGPGVEPERLEG